MFRDELWDLIEVNGKEMHMFAHEVETVSGSTPEYIR